MKKLNMVLTSLMVLTLTACGSGGGGDTGGGGGGGGGGGTAGSATYDSLSNSSASNVCFKSSGTFGTAGSCSVAGTPSIQNSSGTCSAGTAKITCTASGRVYTLSAGGGAAADTACANAGGTISVTCPILVQATCTTNSGSWTAPTSPDVSTSGNCSAQGGTFYTSLSHLTGSFSIQSLGVGSNRVSADPTEVATAMGLFNGAFDLDSTNITLVSMSATLTLSNKWDAAAVMIPSIYNLRSSAVELNVISAAATDSNVSVKTNSVMLYYY